MACPHNDRHALSSTLHCTTRWLFKKQSFGVFHLCFSKSTQSQAPFESVTPSSTLFWPLPRKRLIFLAAGSGPPVPSVLIEILAHKQLSPWLKGAHLLLVTCTCRCSSAVLGHPGPRAVGRGKDGQRFPMAGSSREDAQCLAATSKQKLSVLGVTAGQKPTGCVLLIWLCMRILLLGQQRLKGARCRCLHLCDVDCRWANMFCR